MDSLLMGVTMKSGIILYIVVLCAESSNRRLEYKNYCGTLTVSQPAIDGNCVLLTFIPNGTVDEETEVQLKLNEANVTWTISNSSEYILSSRQNTYTMDIYYEKSDKGQYSAKLITPADECSSGWVCLDIRNGMFNITPKDTVLQAPTGCGILYKGPDRIKPDDEVVLKYYPTKRDEYIRQLRVKTDDCVGQFGCPVNEAWYEEENTGHNSMFFYRFRKFSSKMEGNYLIQCTNRSSHNNATNDVKLIISVPPSSPTFLNTMDVENCTSCILVRSGTTARIQCHVIGGTPPVTVKIAIDGKDEVRCDFDQPFNKTCNASKYVISGLHLKDIRCEAENEALDQPLTTSTKLYVVENPVGPTLYSLQQTEGKVNIYCKTWFGRPAPNLSLLIDGNLINTTIVPTEDPDKHIKLSYLKRDWNGAEIECCMKHLYYAEQKCSDKENVDYIFSPASVTLTSSKPKPSGTGGFRQTLQCTIVNANPACGVKWNHPDGAKVTLKTIARPSGQGGNTTVSELLLNGNMEINGSEIDCQPNCDKFETNDIATYTIRIPAKDEQNSASRDDTLPWKYICICTAAGVVVLVLLAILVIRRRRNTDSHKTAHENVPMNASSGQAMVNEPRDEQNGSDAYETIIAHENIPTNPSSGQALIKEQTDEQNGSNAYEIFIEPGPSDSVYTYLVLPTEGATSGDPERAYAETQTEHVSTKFNKVGEQLPESSDIELENIYVNQ